MSGSAYCMTAYGAIPKLKVSSAMRTTSASSRPGANAGKPSRCPGASTLLL